MADNFDLLALDSIIESYDYAADPLLQAEFAPIEAELCTHIANYGSGINEFGPQMAAHLQRTSHGGEEFLVEALGFSEAAGRNFYHANLLQDLGKIHPKYDPNIWNLPHRPTDEERTEKRKHIHRGPEVLAQALAHASEDLKKHPHIAIVIPAIMLFHHERVDGAGPYSKTGGQMGAVIRAACIVDAADGDMIPRSHQPAGRSEKEVLRRMMGLEEGADKYKGAFDEMLDAYTAFRESKTGEKIV